MEFQIRNDAGDVLPVGEPGEICIKGHNIMMGYWNNPEATEASIKDGWLLTGDIGRLDEDGYIYITDRKKDMLLVNGINVYEGSGGGDLPVRRHQGSRRRRGE